MTCRLMCDISMNFNAVVAAHLLHDSFLIVIAKRTAKFIIVHSWPVFLNAPTPGHLPPKQNLHCSVKYYLIKIFHKTLVN